MSNNGTIYLTDAQYLDLLKRGRAHLDTVTKVESEDSNMVGNKYTETNVGLCNDYLTTKETAMWPDEFPHIRISMLYRENHHKCPMDTRPRSPKNVNGCFYTCRVFKGGLKDLDVVKKLYDDLIAEVEGQTKKIFYPVER